MLVLVAEVWQGSKDCTSNVNSCCLNRCEPENMVNKDQEREESDRQRCLSDLCWGPAANEQLCCCPTSGQDKQCIQDTPHRHAAACAPKKFAKLSLIDEQGWPAVQGWSG